ncbi:MAG: T9SS type A sorting domain-containing protein [Phaeodactylibacter sp.]|nr:T9SS type A sorting domain-containing protein [Phaeodactylibacter sp.]
MKTLQTLFLILPVLAFGQWSTVEMPAGRIQTGGAAADGKIYIAGGVDDSFQYTADVTVFDTQEESWSELSLAQGRAKIACAVAGGKLLCGGGILFETVQNFDLVDIIDLQSGAVDIGILSAGRTELSAVAVGTKVLFAGGFAIHEIPQSPTIPVPMTAYDVVDIYDTENNTWTTAQLSVARGGMAHAVAGSKAFFAGGYLGNGEVTDVVDIYDSDTDTWTTSTLSQARAFYGGGASNGSKVFFAGGILPGDEVSKVVDIYDLDTQNWSVDSLSVPRWSVQAAALGDNVFFSGGGLGYLEGWRFSSGIAIVDIYNTATGTWDTYDMGIPRFNHVCLSAGRKVLFAGGFDFNFQLSPTAHVFMDATVSSSTERAPSIPFEIFPNPVQEAFYLRLRQLPKAGTLLSLTDTKGRAIPLPEPNEKVMQYNIDRLPAGIYFLAWRDGEQVYTEKLVKQ